MLIYLEIILNRRDEYTTNGIYNGFIENILKQKCAATFALTKNVISFQYIYMYIFFHYFHSCKCTTSECTQKEMKSFYYRNLEIIKIYLLIRCKLLDPSFTWAIFIALGIFVVPFFLWFRSIFLSNLATDFRLVTISNEIHLWTPRSNVEKRVFPFAIYWLCMKWEKRLSSCVSTHKKTKRAFHFCVFMFWH